MKILVPTFKIFLGAVVLTTLSNCAEKDNYPNKVIVDTYSDIIFVGDTFKARIIPINSDQWNEKITYEDDQGNEITKNSDNNELNLSIKCDHEGIQQFKGFLNVKTKNGITKIPFSRDFIIDQPTPIVKTNFMIRGIENPIEIAIKGVPSALIKLSSKDAIIFENGWGKFIVTPKKTGKLIISAKIKNGSHVTKLDNIEFEVFEKK